MPENQLSRRDMLKLGLALGGGISAAAFLPARWLKPVVKTGVLPAHAIASACETYQFTPAWEPVGNAVGKLYAIVSPAPADGTLINYMITSTTFGSPLLPAGGAPDVGVISSTVAGSLMDVGGVPTWVASFPGTYGISMAVAFGKTYTIQWTLGNCTYTQTYTVAAT